MQRSQQGSQNWIKTNSHAKVAKTYLKCRCNGTSMSLVNTRKRTIYTSRKSIWIQYGNNVRGEGLSSVHAGNVNGVMWCQVFLIVAESMVLHLVVGAQYKRKLNQNKRARVYQPKKFSKRTLFSPDGRWLACHTVREGPNVRQAWMPRSLKASPRHVGRWGSARWIHYIRRTHERWRIHQFYGFKI